MYEETLTGRPHDTSIQKATCDNENVDAILCLQFTMTYIQIRKLNLLFPQVNVSLATRPITNK